MRLPVQDSVVQPLHHHVPDRPRMSPMLAYCEKCEVSWDGTGTCWACGKATEATVHMHESMRNPSGPNPKSLDRRLAL